MKDKKEKILKKFGMKREESKWLRIKKEKLGNFRKKWMI